MANNSTQKTLVNFCFVFVFDTRIQTGLGFEVPMLQFSKGWNYRHAPGKIHFVLNLFMYMKVLLPCIDVHHRYGWCPRSQKKVSDPQELEVEIVVSPNVGTRNQTQILYKSNKCS